MSTEETPTWPAEPWRAAVLPPDPGDDPLRFRCPRCEAEVAERLYGPCEECRRGLRDNLGGDAREVVEADYVPKMNVTPNAVALKD